MQACDRATTERFGVAPLELMRAAGAAVAAFAQEQFPRARRVTVLCGKGRNGGDGMVAARLLTKAGLEVTTVLLGGPEGLASEAAAARAELKSGAHGPIHVVAAEPELEGISGALQTDLIVDAVLGTGFNPPLQGLALAALEWAKGSAAPVLAVDLPTGWPADEIGATVEGPVFRADAVITFTAPKPAHVFGQLTQRSDGPVVVAPIGSPEAAVASALGLDWAGASAATVRAARAAAAHKGSFGHVLVVGGTYGTAGGKAGAPAMTALGALRAGAGLVTAAVPAPALSLVAGFAPELMTWPLAATAVGYISAENGAPDQVAALTAGKTVLAVGPGMGRDPETLRFVTALLSSNRQPVVLDADALNILSTQPVLLGRLTAFARQGTTVVLTPHPGEMAQLLGITAAEVQANRLEVALGYAERMGVTVVLKGARTLIAHPSGRVAVNTSGNPGMAKGGSGDLLTGLIAGLLAQYPEEPARAVEAAVYLHGLAADMAVREGNEHTLLATDGLQQLSRAFRFESRRANGYVWLQGLPADA